MSMLANRLRAASIGLTLLVLCSPTALAETRRRADIWVRYDNVPRRVREVLDRERGRHEVKQIVFVRRDNREFYRCVIDTKGDDLAIRINPVGKLLSVEDV